MSVLPHILVVDDDTRIRTLLKKYLEEHRYIVSTAANGEAAQSILTSFAYDLLIVDVMMPGQSGFELVKDIRGHSDVPVLMLTAMGDVEDRIKGLECGADDYLAKPFEPKELLLRIDKILSRIQHKTIVQQAAIPAVIHFGPWSYHMETKTLISEQGNTSLTTREHIMLYELAKHRKRPLSRAYLASKCGGINERSVDVQMIRLRQKIEKDPKNPRYLQTRRGEGYILYADQDE